MSWQGLLRDHRVKRHRTSPQEMYDLRAVVERDLKDARIPELSADRRFATAYNAVLQTAKMILALEGYRVTGPGQHQTTFEALDLALGGEVAELSPYFDVCRRKRNQVDYDMAEAASETEAAELIVRAGEFQQMAEGWIRRHHPEYAI